MKENLHKGHRERMRSRALTYGTRSFPDHELVEMFLFYAIPRTDTNPIAHRLLKRFGSIQGILDADLLDLKSVDGIGDSAAHMIKLTAELLCRYLKQEPSSRDVFTNIGQVASYLYPKFIGTNRECLYMMRFNNRLSLLGCDLISEGVINCSDVMMRKITELIIHSNTSAILLAHNHPDGLAIASQNDKDANEKIRTYVENMSVQLMDHLIFAGTRYASLMKDFYGTYRVSPLSQQLDPEFFESFYKVDGDEYKILPRMPKCLEGTEESEGEPLAKE